MKREALKVLGIAVLGSITVSLHAGGVAIRGGFAGSAAHPAASNPHPAAPAGGACVGSPQVTSPGNWSPPNVWGNVSPQRVWGNAVPGPRGGAMLPGLGKYPPGNSLGSPIPGPVGPSGFDAPPGDVFGGFIEQPPSNFNHHGGHRHDGPGPGTIQGFDNNPVQGFDPEPVTGFTPEPVTGLTPEPVSGLTPDAVSGFNPDPITGFTPQPVQGFRGGINDNRQRPIRSSPNQHWNRRGTPIYQGPGDSPFPTSGPPFGAVIDITTGAVISPCRADRPLSSVDLSATVIDWAGIRVVRSVRLGASE